MLTEEQKQRIAEAMVSRREMFAGTDSQWALSLGINASVYNRIKRGERERVLADAKWITIARLLEVELSTASPWNTARTAVFVSVTAQLGFCQENSSWAILCDEAGIGKTYAARYYSRTNKNVVYVDCSQHKTRRRLMIEIARALGVDTHGTYYEVFDDLRYYIKTIDHPLIILDEAGDLRYEAFLEVKALWNAVENCCGIYMLGADGLRAKIERGINCRKVGFVELFDRQGARFQRITPEGREARQEFHATQAAAVIRANAPTDTEIRAMLAATDCRLRRIYIEVKKRMRNEE